MGKKQVTIFTIFSVLTLLLHTAHASHYVVMDHDEIIAGLFVDAVTHQDYLLAEALMVPHEQDATLMCVLMCSTEPRKIRKVKFLGRTDKVKGRVSFSLYSKKKTEDKCHIYKFEVKTHSKIKLKLRVAVHKDLHKVAGFYVEPIGKHDQRKFDYMFKNCCRSLKAY